MKENVELRKIARTQLKGTWLAAVGMVLVYSQWGLIPRPLGRFELAKPNKKWY
ncbi:MAG: DUF975 family protein [Spirochaetaceae bacterium]|nr:DUF975 family protein [Spirochaetaceae bacterium]